MRSVSNPGLGPVTLDERAWSVWFVGNGRFCYPSADMATYLYPKALEEARGIGAPIDQMNEGDKDRAIILPNGMLIESVAEAYYAARRRVPASSLRAAATCGASCSSPAWCPLRA